MTEALTLNPWTVVILVAMWFAAYMTAKALANAWRPMWQPVAYCGLLGFADRFLVFALYDGDLFSLTGYLVDTAVLIAISVLAFQLNRAKKMVSQYPWLYEPAGPLGWRKIRE